MKSNGYAIDLFARIIAGKRIQTGSGGEVNHIVLDSRKFQVKDGSVFFALITGRSNGHQYIAEAYAKGIRNFVVSEQVTLIELQDANVVLVHDTLVALQAIAGYNRAQFPYPVLAITGSNGKTIVKEWLGQMLQGAYRVVKSPKSYNSQIGVPLSLMRIDENHNFALIEAGISLPGEMPRLEKIIRPNWGIFTTIGPAHQENFTSLAQKIQEKLSLFDRAAKLIYCSDQPEVKAGIAKRWQGGGPEIRDWSYKNPKAALLITTSIQESGHTKLTGKYRGETREVTVPFCSKASLENAGHCWLLMLDLELPTGLITEKMAGLNPVAMRLEQLEGIHGCVVINDVYNTDFASLEIALEHLKLQRKNSRFTAIVSDIPQTGENPDVLYGRLAELLEVSGIDRFIGIGPEISARSSYFAGIPTTVYPSTELFLANFQKDAFREENILIKGARAFAFERISERLEEKSHETVLEIDLNKMADNLAYIRGALKPATKIMVMVKAFAYGSGGYDVARFLELKKVDYLAVAYADEGVALRQAGIEIPIMVLNPEVSSYDAIIRYKLEPQIFSFRTLALFVGVLKKHYDEAPYPIHIKINTGMNRLGFEPEDASKLGQLLMAEDLLRTVSVFTHLSASENPDFDAHTARQLARFKRATDSISAIIGDRFMRHALNSSGTFRQPEAQMDMVRIGLALYGLTGNIEARKRLQPVSRLKTVISQIREVPAGEGIGYSPKTMLTEPRFIAVVPVGYADGLPRKLGNGNWSVLIGGKKVPFIGNICMDMCMIDVTGVDCREGDEAEIFGDHCTIYDLADALETIPYEVLTNVSTRVKRIFLQE